MPMEFGCLDCGSISDQKRCPRHRRTYRQQRKAEGRTGARGSTRATRARRERVLTAARDETGIPRCFYCGAEATVEDHFVPKARGGSDADENMVAACASCNSAKGDRDPQEFMADTATKRLVGKRGGGGISGGPDRTPPLASPRKKAKSGRG